MSKLVFSEFLRGFLLCLEFVGKICFPFHELCGLHLARFKLLLRGIHLLSHAFQLLISHFPFLPLQVLVLESRLRLGDSRLHLLNGIFHAVLVTAEKGNRK